MWATPLVRCTTSLSFSFEFTGVEKHAWAQLGIASPSISWPERQSPEAGFCTCGPSVDACARSDETPELFSVAGLVEALAR